jgi:hypothetical protein
MSRNLGALTSWNPVGLFRPVMGQLYLLLSSSVEPWFKENKLNRNKTNKNENYQE